MELTTQQDLARRFRGWFEGGNGKASIKATIDDNRRRYRMLLADAAEREARGLSALASTKSTSIVDNAVVDAVQEYYATDALAFTANDSGEANKDHLARWLTEIFRMRAENNGFWIWMVQSLKAGFVDGVEAGMVRWRKESYDVPDNHYYDLRAGREITREEYNEAKRQKWPLKIEGPFNPAKGAPEIIKLKFEECYRAERNRVPRTVMDTWEVVQLKPGESLMWDFKNPLLDINKGQWCIAVLAMTVDQMLALSKQGIFKRGLSDEELRGQLHTGNGSISDSTYTDFTAIGTDPDTVDMGNYNTGEVWACFEKVNHQWMVSFSIRGTYELSTPKPVNDIFFGGRPFDKLPVFLGASDIELWEAMGRGIPKLIAPLEDEHINHRNNINDIANQAVQGRWRLDDESDIDIDSLLNSRVFYGKQGEAEKLDMSGEMAVVMRAADSIGSDIAEVAPVGMQSQFMIPQGGPQGTLGGAQLALGNQDKRLSTRLLIRNVTVMRPLMRIIAEMEFAYETDETLARIAGKAAKMDIAQVSAVDGSGQMFIDFRALDFDVDVQINAGLGNTPKQQKVQKLLQFSEWCKANGMPVDLDKIKKQVLVLNGFNEDQFDLAEPPPPPPSPVDYKANISIDLATLLQLAPQEAQQLLQRLLSGEMNITANMKEPKTPSYLKEPPQGSMSHPLTPMQGQGMDQPMGQMGGA